MDVSCRTESERNIRDKIDASGEQNSRIISSTGEPALQQRFSAGNNSVYLYTAVSEKKEKESERGLANDRRFV